MEERPWLEHYDEGVPKTIDYPLVPLFQFLEDSASKYPNHPCTIFKGAVITYKEMNELTDRLAAGLMGVPVQVCSVCHFLEMPVVFSLLRRKQPIASPVSSRFRVSVSESRSFSTHSSFISPQS